MVREMLLVLLTMSGTVFSLSCKDMNNKDIAWFSLIKIPTSISPTKGLEFMYLDPNNQAPVIQPVLLNDQNALSYTLLQLNNKSISSFVFK